jgi:hypothetical protein
LDIFVAGLIRGANICFYGEKSSVADPDHFDADPDPTSEKNRIQIRIRILPINLNLLPY